MNNKWYTSYLKVLIPVISVGFLSFFKFFPVLGGFFKPYFALSAVIGPLCGLYSGLGITASILFVKRILFAYFTGSSLLNPLAWYLPTLSAAWYWRSESVVVRALLPFACMILFIVHPIGSQAWIYALYWLIPLVIYAVSCKHIVLDALASTFVQHAVGSVLWLYCMPTTVESWYVLLPLVIIERCIFASGMLAVMYTVEGVRDIIVLAKQHIAKRSVVK